MSRKWTIGELRAKAAELNKGIYVPNWEAKVEDHNMPSGTSSWFVSPNGKIEEVLVTCEDCLAIIGTDNTVIGGGLISGDADLENETGYAHVDDLEREVPDPKRVLEGIRDDIEAFEEICQEAEYTDSAGVWDLLTTWRQRIEETLEEQA